MKRNLAFILIALCSITVMAKPRTNSEAMLLAKRYAQQMQLAPNAAIQINPVSSLSVKGMFKAPNATDAALYIYNIGTGNGFIIISGDDCSKPVLGYSNTGSINMNEMPVNLRSWLNSYREQIVYAQANNLVQKTSKHDFSHRPQGLPETVSPLLGNITWDQMAPYNNLCPLDTLGKRSVTGCVATAEAQVMKFWQWPIQGTGSHSYYCPGTKSTLSANFGETKYDWTNMLDKYTSTATKVQQTAVATLMLHCGIACNMQYHSSCSNAFTEDLAKGLISYFGYDSNLQVKKRYYYTTTVWENIVRTELAAGRPVLYGGCSKDAGHQFICDGYDNKGLFHINWGWNGHSNAYFELDALDPESLGTGGGTETGYKIDQDIIIGVAPQGKIQSEVNYELKLNSDMTAVTDSINKGSELKLTLPQISNIGINDFKGTLGVGLYNNAGKLIKVYTIEEGMSILSEEEYSPNLDGYELLLPDTLSEASYKLYSIYKATNQTDYSIIHGIAGRPYYLKVNVYDSYFFITMPNEEFPKLTLVTDSVSRLTKGEKATFKHKIKNEGGEYSSYIIKVLTDSNDSLKSYIVAYDYMDLEQNATKSSNMTEKITAPAGKYKLYTLFDSDNNFSAINTKDLMSYKNFEQLGDPVEVTVNPPTSPQIGLNSILSFPNNDAVYKYDVKLNTVKILNVGTAFNDSIVVDVIQGTQSVASFGKQKVSIGAGEEAEVNFSGQLSKLDNGTYTAVLFYKDGTKWNLMDNASPEFPNYVKFVLTDTQTGLKDEALSGKTVTVYPSPAKDVIHITSEIPVSRIRICDVTGKEILTVSPAEIEKQTINIAGLPAGIYVINCDTAQGSIFKKFAKE